ncbi:MAG TPA: hypothetical protein VI815_04605 [Candidatus Nanoarchaeia archaeon]|nr:hypothetical protein [Candidatus Nanoarchaeia archaeon]
MILIISTCKESLHELEFVKPISEILQNNKIKFKIVNYKKIDKKSINSSDKIIITGTSLADNDFINYINNFSFIESYNKPMLGICSGMHIIGLVFKGKLKKQKQIGPIEISLIKEFLGLEPNKKHQVYSLHNLYVDFSKMKTFKVYSYVSCPQAVKHNSKELYGVLFHPEVRNIKIIENFLKL